MLRMLDAQPGGTDLVVFDREEKEQATGRTYGQAG
jgi:hypothetical protein